VEHLGSGQFGTVNKGVWQSPGGAVEVAVKMLKSGSDETDEVKFLQEAAIMGQFKHPNVIKLHGVVTVGKPVSVAHCICHPCVNVHCYQYPCMIIDNGGVGAHAAW